MESLYKQDVNKNPRNLLGYEDLYWLRGQDLNLGPLGYEPNELPGCSTPLNLFYSNSSGSIL